MSCNPGSGCEVVGVLSTAMLPALTGRCNGREGGCADVGAGFIPTCSLANSNGLKGAMTGGTRGTTRLGGFGPATRLGDFGPTTRLGGFGPTTRLGGFGSTTRLGGFGPTTRLGGFGPTTRLGGFGSTTRLGGFGATTRLGGFGATTRLGAFDLATKLIGGGGDCSRGRGRGCVVVGGVVSIVGAVVDDAAAVRVLVLVFGVAIFARSCGFGLCNDCGCRSGCCFCNDCCCSCRSCC